MGRQPVLEPYYVPATPPTDGEWPPSAPPQGFWYSLPIGGSCGRSGGGASSNCTWDRPHFELHRLVYGVDLLAHGWLANNSYDEPSGDRIDLTYIIAANAAALQRAMGALDDVLAPSSCDPPHARPLSQLEHAVQQENA